MKNVDTGSRYRMAIDCTRLVSLWVIIGLVLYPYLLHYDTGRY
jgi:hypothetical protein